MMRKTITRFALIALALVGVGIQLVPVDRSNPPVQQDVMAPAAVKSLLRGSCYDCHSNETSWPWYSYVAPASWWVAADVREAREKLNFSTWSRLGPREREHSIREAWNEVREGEMPLSIYLFAHPGARLAPEDREPLRLWAELETVAPAGGESIRGYARFGHEVRALRPCESQDDLWAIDRSGLLWELHRELAPHREIYEELFVIVRGQLGPAPQDGFGADYAGGVIVDEVLYVAREGFGCETDWASFEQRAQGNEPSWSVVVSDGTMRLSRLGEPPRTWSGVRELRTGEISSFAGVGEDGRPVELAIERAPCRDSMSGSYHALRATLSIGAERLEGCAVTGDAGPAP